MAAAAIRMIDRLSSAMALVAGMAVVVLSALIVFDVVSRRFFQYSVQGTDELGGYTLALIGSLGLTYTLLQRGHPRIDIALRHFPAPLRRVLHVLAYLALFGFAAFMTVHAFSEFGETIAFSTVTNTPLQTPLWAPQSFWVFGTTAFALSCLVLAAHGAFLLFTDPEEVERRYGPITVEEEVQEYVGEEAAGSINDGGRA